ncbi:MAG: GFA family protein [Deltaproteobacteria bacterium]|nr:GFA family protein [Deltaproteobacteria bacterium]MBT7155138.1 GFA family protein [Deltaproteobacteria bacterium]MBT7892055.1 GFA family protein [Deltaproteobacteria bacterium]
MLLKGSCHCGSVQFQVESPHPYPYNLCYCSVCRKTAGGGGYAINLSGLYYTLKIKGAEHKSVYHAIIDGRQSLAERNFCMHCGSALWLYDARWPELVHPFASAIDTDLPIPPERTHLMLGSKGTWPEVDAKSVDKMFLEYPEESIAQWHERLNLAK